MGLLFFFLFPILFNAALVFTTAARGALALSTLPLLTMLAAAGLGVETLTARKSLGLLVRRHRIGPLKTNKHTIFCIAASLVSGDCQNILLLSIKNHGWPSLTRSPA